MKNSGDRPSVDLPLLLVTIALVGIGMVMVYSSSYVLAESKFQSSGFFLKRHVVRALLGLVLMFSAIRIDYRFLRKLSKPLLVFGFGLLFLVLAPKLFGGDRGVSRWMRIAGVSVQPSELMKLIIVLYLADSLTERQDRIKNFTWGLLPYVLILSSAISLILLQPALGTAVGIGIVAGVMLFLSRARLYHLVVVALASLPVLYGLVFWVGYRRERIEAFLHPTRDLEGINYQVNQSLLAFGSGGFWGVGLGHSRQKLLFLPEPHTDFIFSIIGEELGFFGAITVLTLFLIFIWRGLRTAKRAPDLFGFLLAAGITTMIATYTILNIGVAIGLFPTTGLPLPFISYGGSSLLVSMAGTGVLLNISRQRYWQWIH
ncbi:MAG TPA: putative lipid II flippase FtsW [Candidatus Latescibacteria bacterium]|nr:putative lipid II flippase FtsW [Candidatus Latescibacterota bacterium]